MALQDIRVRVKQPWLRDTAKKETREKKRRKEKENPVSRGNNARACFLRALLLSSRVESAVGKTL